MTYSIYDTFTIEEAGSVGSKFRAICKATYGYEAHLSDGKEYEIEITPRILELSPLCKLVGNTGKVIECHLHRFDKVK
jgi:hypothetical protein